MSIPFLYEKKGTRNFCVMSTVVHAIVRKQMEKARLCIERPKQTLFYTVATQLWWVKPTNRTIYKFSELSLTRATCGSVKVRGALRSHNLAVLWTFSSPLGRQFCSNKNVYSSSCSLDSEILLSRSPYFFRIRIRCNYMVHSLETGLCVWEMYMHRQ